MKENRIRDVCLALGSVVAIVAAIVGAPTVYDLLHQLKSLEVQVDTLSSTKVELEMATADLKTRLDEAAETLEDLQAAVQREETRSRQLAELLDAQVQALASVAEDLERKLAQADEAKAELVAVEQKLAAAELKLASLVSKLDSAQPATPSGLATSNRIFGSLTEYDEDGVPTSNGVETHREVVEGSDGPSVEVNVHVHPKRSPAPGVDRSVRSRTTRSRPTTMNPPGPASAATLRRQAEERAARASRATSRQRAVTFEQARRAVSAGRRRLADLER